MLSSSRFAARALRPRFVLPWLVAVAAFALAACDLDSGSAPSATCAEAGSQCLLGNGPLGVCERTPCPPGATPPCFQCTPQH